MDITKDPNKILHKKLELVPEITDEIRNLIAQMHATMLEAKGVGLAANQVGENLQIFVIDKKLAEEHKHEEHKAPHGGPLLEVGEEEAHLELVHDEKAGKLTLYLLGKDAKTPVAIKDAPKVNLKTDKGPKQIETKAVEAKDGLASCFEATDDALKADPLNGRIALTLGEKKYNVELKHEHGH